MNQFYRILSAAIVGIFLCCAASAQQTYTYTYNAAGDRTYKSGIGPEETAGRSAAAVSASGQGPAQARTSVPAPRTLSTGSTVAGVDLSCDVGRIPVSSSVTPTSGHLWELIGRGVVAFVSGAVDGWLSVNGLVGLGGAVSAGANEWLSGGDIGECLSAAGRDLILSYVGFTLGKYGE